MKRQKRWIPRCVTPGCNLRARWIVDGLPMCTKHKDVQKYDEGVKIKKMFTL